MDILAAAGELGIGGSGSSFRVTLNAVDPGVSLQSFTMQTGSGTGFEFAPLAYGATTASPLVTGVPSDSGAGLAQAPAPAVGSTPVGAALSLGLLGLLGLAPRPRRARFAARA